MYRQLKSILVFVAMVLILVPLQNIAFAEEPEVDTIEMSTLDIDSIPAYSGSPMIVFNGNIPVFEDWSRIEKLFVLYSPLDDLGRTGTVYACVSKYTKSTNSQVNTNYDPSGWNNLQFDELEGKQVFNRVQLLPASIGGDASNPENIISGTWNLEQWTNIIIEKIAKQRKQSGAGILLRATPCYHGDELVPFGVQLEALTINPLGSGYCCNMFFYNEQRDFMINHATGETMASPGFNSGKGGWIIVPDWMSFNNVFSESDLIAFRKDEAIIYSAPKHTYILNPNTDIFHLGDCYEVKRMNPENRQTVIETRQNMIEQGYKPCGKCNP